MKSRKSRPALTEKQKLALNLGRSHWEVQNTGCLIGLLRRIGYQALAEQVEAARELALIKVRRQYELEKLILEEKEQKNV